jgi:hypothetical protein
VPSDESAEALTTDDVMAMPPSPQESAKFLRDYMSKAHEDKLRAISDIEAKYKAQIKVSMPKSVRRLEDHRVLCHQQLHFVRIHHWHQRLESKITELENKIAVFEGRAPISRGNGSFEMPATNKQLAKKVAAYQCFLSDYLVKSQIEKLKAVRMAEKKLVDYYQAIIAEIMQGGSFE